MLNLVSVFLLDGGGGQIWANNFQTFFDGRGTPDVTRFWAWLGEKNGGGGLPDSENSVEDEAELEQLTFSNFGCQCSICTFGVPAH